MAREQQHSTDILLTVSSTSGRRSAAQVTPEAYVDSVLDQVRPQLIDRVQRLAAGGSPLPAPDDMADLLRASFPVRGPAELDPHYADIGPFYDSAGASRQLGGVTKQALDSRRSNQTVLAMQTGDGHWLYPAWQFTGDGGIHRVLAPVLKALRGLDRWAAGVWLISGHPDLGGRSPRQVLSDGVGPDVVARLARHDRESLVG